MLWFSILECRDAGLGLLACITFFKIDLRREKCLKRQREGIVFANCIKDECPCKISVNCPNYTNRIWKQRRDDDYDIIIHEWYDIRFRTTYHYPDIIANGQGDNNMDIVPEANFCIETCKNGTPARNAIFLATETDYLLTFQTTRLPKPVQLFRYLDNNSAAIVKE